MSLTTQKKDVLCQGARNIRFVLAITGRENLWRITLVQQKVDDVEEALEIAVLEIITDGDEGGRDAGGETNGVLNIEILHCCINVVSYWVHNKHAHSLNTSLVTALRV